MPADRLELEESALVAYQRAIAAVRECKTLYENAQLPVPVRVVNFLGEASSPTPVDASSKKLVVPPPIAPPRPIEARSDWLFLACRKAAATSLILATLRDAGSQVVAKALKERLDQLVPEKVSPGVFANVGTRLAAAGVIKRDDNGWLLLERDRAPVLHNGHLWGPVAAFEAYDVAEHRRDCVEHALRAALPDGLQIMQITRFLEQAAEAGWLHAPLSKDLVKTDMATLDREDRAKRVGGGGKWRAVMSE